MTLDQLKALLRDVLEKEKAATPGPWHSTNGWVGQDGACIANCVNYRMDEDAAFIALARNVSPAMAKTLLGEIEWHEKNVAMAKKWDSLTSVGILGKISEKRLAAILAQFTQTPTL